MAFLGVLCQLNAEVRMPTLVENFYKHLFEPNKEYTWKQDLNREREKKKCFLKWQFVTSFMHLEFGTTRKIPRGAGANQAGTALRDS